MIFNRIILNNFRQFKGRVDIDLSSKDKDRNIVVFLGSNGAGKTTFAQSLRYCMFGSGSNYLKLSRLDELINNTLIYEMDELNDVEMFVEVHFSKKDTKYIAKRTANFQKQKGKLSQINEEFFLSKSTPTGGYKPVSSEAEALNLMFQMMPPGLAYLYLFDGERLEKNISQGTSLKEVQETIRGFLNLKKYEVLIEKIGSEGKARTLINVLENSVGSSKGEEQKVKEEYNKYVSDIGTLEADLDKIEDRMTEIDTFINRHKDIQRKQSDIAELENHNNVLEADVRRIDQQISDKSQIYNNRSHKALLYKAIRSVKSKYDSVMENHSGQQKKYFKSLHVDTLEQILAEEVCICGTDVKRGTVLYERISNLFETALPNDYTSNLETINQFFTASTNLLDEKEKLSELHREIIELKHEKNGLVSEIDNNNQLIRNLETQFNRDDQIKIDEMLKEKEKQIEARAKKQQLLTANIDRLGRIKPKYDEIMNKNDSNRAVRRMIELLKEESYKLKDILIEQDSQARELLAKNFDRYLAQVLPEKYEISIDEKYRFKLEQVIDPEKGRKVDSTEELSKGQSAVLSMVFLRALLETSKEMSSVVSEDFEHGIVMDASMATLDSRNVHRLATKIVSDFDQLLFLSVDRQLRDEMFEGIRDRISKAFVIDNKENKATITPIEIIDLEERLKNNREV